MDSKYAEMGNSKYELSNNFRMKGNLAFNKNNIAHNQTKSSPNKRVKYNEEVDLNLSNTSDSRQISKPPKTLLEQRKQLPVYNVRSRLMEHISKNATVLIIGETGSGKTTQIPQFIWESGLTKGSTIAITQPRRVAVITVAQRVAQEQGSTLGELVGYSVRFEEVVSKRTRIRYMTDGLLLREALLDKYLSKYSVVILDEAHERTINTDVLFGIAKKAQEKRAKAQMAPLKLIIMSATMDVENITKYFEGCLPVYLTGRSYPINVNHVTTVHEDYVFSSLVTIFKIHQTAPARHDILVFLTGQEEIEAMVQAIRHTAKDPLLSNGPTLRVYPFYSGLSQLRQLEVFRPTAPNCRKVIVSTNIAETSVTISGIKYVIDCGKVKTRIHDSNTGLEKLKVVTISKAQAWQRTGRAGRESAGFCYRVYTLKQFEDMPDDPTPEILRTNITTTLLQLLAMRINVENFDFIDKPSKESIVYGLKQLQMLGAITDYRTPELTKLGWKMSAFPLDPRYSKLLLCAPDFGCMEEMLSLVSLMSGENIYHLPYENRDKHLENHRRFESTLGDHITLLNVYREFQNNAGKKSWCHENSLNSRSLLYARDVRSQLNEICDKFDLPMSSCGLNMDQVRKCLIAGLFGNTAERQRDKKYITLQSRQTAYLHPSSCLMSQQPQCVLFTEIMQTSKTYLRQITAIESEWISEIVPNWRSICM